jgi:hypothetical protein
MGSTRGKESQLTCRSWRARRSEAHGDEKGANGWALSEGHVGRAKPLLVKHDLNSAIGGPLSISLFQRHLFCSRSDDHLDAHLSAGKGLRNLRSWALHLSRQGILTKLGISSAPMSRMTRGVKLGRRTPR